MVLYTIYYGILHHLDQSNHLLVDPAHVLVSQDSAPVWGNVFYELLLINLVLFEAVVTCCTTHVEQPLVECDFCMKVQWV